MTSTPDLPALDLRQRRREEVRGVIRMSVPVVITLCSRMCMDIADYFMISQMTPAEAAPAQAAMLPAQITMWTFIVTGVATVSIVNTFVSQSLGRGRLRETSAYAWQGIYLSFTYGTLGLLLYPLLPHVFAWIGHAPEVQARELIYSRICLFTVSFTVAAEALSSFFNGLHQPKVTMWSAIEANLLNVVLSTVLIFGFLGFPAMGIAGAAWGTLIGVIYRFLRLGITFTHGRFAQDYHSRQSWRLDRSKLRAIIRVGLPNGFQATSDVFVWMVFANILIGRMFGETSLIASNTAWQYLRLTFMPAFGVGIALSALVGKAIGQRDHELAQRMTKTALGFLLVYLTLLTVVLVTCRSSLIAVFNSNAEVVRIGAQVLICAAVFQVFDGAGILLHCALKGAGDTRWPAFIGVVSHWLLVVGGGYLVATLRPEWGVVGPWVAAATLIIFLALAYWWRWRSGVWQRIDLFARENASETAERPTEEELVVA